jgi:hypothetical protein
VERDLISWTTVRLSRRTALCSWHAFYFVRHETNFLPSWKVLMNCILCFISGHCTSVRLPIKRRSSKSPRQGYCLFALLSAFRIDVFCFVKVCMCTVACPRAWCEVPNWYLQAHLLQTTFRSNKLQLVVSYLIYFQTSVNRGPLHRRSAHTRTTFVTFRTPKSACKWIRDTLYSVVKAILATFFSIQ